MCGRVAENRAVSMPLRARCAALVAVLAIVAVTVARWNPWHYVLLLPAADSGVFLTVMTAALVLLGVAVHIAIRPRFTTAGAAWLAAAMLVLCAWPVFDAMHDSGYERGDPAVIAASADHRFEVVATRYRPRGDNTYFVDRYHLRSRSGVFSREADRAVAEIYRYDAGAAPGAVVAVRFTGPGEVEIQTADDARWTTAFDPHTLSLPSTLTWNGTTGYEWTR
jgi:hypothetical protein